MTKPIQHHRTLTIAVAVVLFAFWAIAAGANSVPMATEPEQSAIVPAPRDGVLPLSLDDAIATALQRNLGLVVQRKLHQRSLLNLAGAFGIYDLNLGGTVSATETSRPSRSSLVVTGGAALQDEQRFWNAQLSRLFPVGGVASVSFQSTRNEDNDANNTFNPSFTQGARLNFNQPLLRNFGRTTTEQNIIVGRIDAGLDQEDFDTQVELLVQDISNTFWQLVEAREQLKVAEEALSLAVELHDNNKIQVRVGTLAPLETVRSEAGVADRKVDIISRTADVEDLEDELRRLLNLDQATLWDVPIEPQLADEIDYADIDLDEVIEAALAHRNDLRRKRAEIERLEVIAKLARNQLKPQLDLDATYGFNGLAGERTTPSGVLPGGFSDAFNQILERDFDTWTLQLTFGFPLRNRAARASRASAEIAVEQGQAELADLRQTAIIEVRRLARAAESAAQQIEAAEISARLEERNLEAERKRYENGLSASFEILRIQEDLAQAQSREVSAISGYRRALVALRLATGELLETHGIELVDAVELDSATFEDITDATVSTAGSQQATGGSE